MKLCILSGTTNWITRKKILDGFVSVPHILQKDHIINELNEDGVWYYDVLKVLYNMKERFLNEMCNVIIY